jgi:hypothetical protein
MREHQGRVQHNAGHQVTPGEGPNLHCEQQGARRVSSAPSGCRMRAHAARAGKRIREAQRSALAAPNAPHRNAGCKTEPLPPHSRLKLRFWNELISATGRGSKLNRSPWEQAQPESVGASSTGVNGSKLNRDPWEQARPGSTLTPTLPRPRSPRTAADKHPKISYEKGTKDRLSDASLQRGDTTGGVGWL